jgi:hypothetical protein
MVDDDRDICGSMETTSGEPCRFSPGESCPWHDTDDAPVTRQTELEQNPDLTDRVADRLAAGDTIAEACAEVDGMSEHLYYKYRRLADSEGGVFDKFAKETTRARKKAGRNDRGELLRAIRENMDTRTWYKLHMKQYGDQYGDEDMDMREPDELVVESEVVEYERIEQ